MLSRSTLATRDRYRTVEAHRTTLIRGAYKYCGGDERPREEYDDWHFERAKISRMKVYRYGMSYGPKLKILLESFANDDAHNVTEEIAHIRAVHMNNLAIYNEVMEAIFPDTVEGKKAREQALRIAGDMLKQTADDVLKAVERSAKIVALTADKLHPGMLDAAIKQLLSFMYQCFDAEDPAMAGRMEAFEKAINEKLQLPSLKQSVQGTTITPDQQVMAMDALVPFVPTES